MYENKFYIHNVTEQQGPFTIEELKLQNIDLSTPIWYEGLNDWSTIGEIEELKLILLNQPIENNPNNQITEKNKIKAFSILESKRIGLIILLFSTLSILISIFEYFDGFSPKLASIITWFSVIGCICTTTLIIVTLIKKKLKLTYFISLILFGASLFSLKIMESEHRSFINYKWMDENLNVDTFRNGDFIGEAKSKEDWVTARLNKQPAWCYYDFNPENGVKYGKLYNWYAVIDSRELAPEGWRLADSHDWWQLVDCWGGLKNAGLKLKKDGEWNSNGINSNISEFSALPAGAIDDSGDFYLKGHYGFWWVDDRTEDSSQSDIFRIADDGHGFDDVDFFQADHWHGRSVRCVDVHADEWH